MTMTNDAPAQVRMYRVARLIDGERGPWIYSDEPAVVVRNCLVESVLVPASAVAKHLAVPDDEATAADRIPIVSAKSIAQAHGYDQVIIYARRVGEPGQEWVTTYGRGKEHCAAAARIGDAIGRQVVEPLRELTARAERAERELAACRAEIAERERVTQAALAALCEEAARCADSFDQGPGDDTPMGPVMAGQVAVAQQIAESIRGLKPAGAIAEMQALAEDRARLDFLDRCNARLNSRYGTSYRWRLILNHNVNRLMLGESMEVDLHDSEGGNRGLPSCRAAIDAERLRIARAGGSSCRSA